MRNMISIRGGGIRGIIPCCCLIELEKQLGGVTRDHIDYCAGTSTGAVAAAKRAFEGFMYDPQHLRDVVASVLGPASDWTMNDSPLRIMISATAMNGHNWYFVRDNAKNARTTGAVKLVDAAVASACAPT